MIMLLLSAVVLFVLSCEVWQWMEDGSCFGLFCMWSWVELLTFLRNCRRWFPLCLSVVVHLLECPFRFAARVTFPLSQFDKFTARRETWYITNSTFNAPSSSAYALPSSSVCATVCLCLFFLRLRVLVVSNTNRYDQFLAWFDDARLAPCHGRYAAFCVPLWPNFVDWSWILFHMFNLEDMCDCSLSADFSESLNMSQHCSLMNSLCGDRN